MKKPNWHRRVMEKTKPQLDISHHQMKPPVSGLSPPENPQITQVIAKTIGGSTKLTDD